MHIINYTHWYIILIISLASCRRDSSKQLMRALTARRRGSGYFTICKGRSHSSLSTARQTHRKHQWTSGNISINVRLNGIVGRKQHLVLHGMPSNMIPSFFVHHRYSMRSSCQSMHNSCGNPVAQHCRPRTYLLALLCPLCPWWLVAQTQLRLCTHCQVQTLACGEEACCCAVPVQLQLQVYAS